MKILMIGGTGVISTEVSKRILAEGHELTLLNRGTQTRGLCPAGAKVITANIRDAEETSRALRG